MTDNTILNNNQQAERFLRVLWPQGIPAGKLAVFSKRNNQTQFYGYEDLAKMVSDTITKAEAADVFYSVCSLDTEQITAGRGSSENVSAIPAVWMDLDYSGNGHVRQDYPPQQEVLNIINECPLKPSLVVKTGNGFHIYLLLDKPFVTNSDESRMKAQALLRRFQNFFRNKAIQRGYDFDDTSDLARLLRLPSTTNHKEGDLLPVCLTEYGDEERRYSIEEIYDVVKGISPKINSKKGKKYPPIEEEKPEIKPPQEPIYADIVEKLRNSPYLLDEQGYLCALDKDDLPVRQANFIIVPKNEIITIDGYSEKREFNLYGILAGGEPLPEVIVEANKFNQIDWVLREWGLQANVFPCFNAKSIVRSVAQHLAKDISIEYRYAHIGWSKFKDKYGYLHAEGCVGQEGTSVIMESFLKSYVLPDKVVDLAAAVRASLSLLDLADNTVTYPLLSLMFLAPLVEPLSQAGITPSFILWLAGSSGSRKTTLANLFLSHFRTYTNSPPASFKDTANSIERKAYLTKDSVLLIDDYHPSTNTAERENMMRVANHILRLYGDRIARGRLNADCSTKADYPPRGLAIVTGEDTISGLSAAARCLNIELLKNIVDLTKLTEAQKKAKLLSQSTLGYIQWLLPNMDKLPDILQKEFLSEREKLNNSDRHGRIDASIIFLKMAFTMFVEYAVYAEAISQTEADALIIESKAVYDKLLHKAEEVIENERPEKLFINTLSSMLASGECFLDLTHPQFGIKDLYPRSKKIGWKEKEYYYIIPEAGFSAVNHGLRAQDMSLPVKQNMLLKLLAGSNFIKTETEVTKGITRERYTIRKSVGGERHRVIAFYRDKLDIETA